MAREKEDTKGKRGSVSLDDEDAIDVGLFAAGPATIKESVFTTYDYQGTSRKPPLVWLLTFVRGKGKEAETYEQPYTIGKGWDLDKKTGLLVPKNGQTGLPKSCNAILYLIKPLKQALKDAKIDASVLSDGDPTVLEGMEVVLDRVEQEKRDIRDNERGRDRGGRGEEREDRGPKTILVIEEVTSAPWEKGTSGKKRKADDDDEDEPAKGKGRAAADDDDDDDADEPPAKGKGAANGKGKAAAASDDDDEDEDAKSGYTEDAVEAIIAAVEKGAVDLDDLEARLTRVLKGNKHAAEIIDIATSTKFLATEKGWVFDKKKGLVDAE